MSASHHGAHSPAPAIFATTRWSVVLAASGQSAGESATALEWLCATYWYPLYAYLRRDGHERHTAQDLTQSFLSHLLQDSRLGKVHPDKGRFRSFLLASLKNFCANERRKAQRLKRGAEFHFISIDEVMGEERFQRELGHGQTPDRAFEQTWAVTLLETVLVGLREQYAQNGRADTFDALQVHLSGERNGTPYAATATRLGTTEAAVKMAVLRLRRRFAEALRAEIEHTVTSAEEVDEEIRCLFAAVSGSVS